ncbi:hypothetical protein L1887_31585 [Cichorium endivia]|nr:hypothetical protein L1887_31585 [Cichorium endivia]
MRSRQKPHNFYRLILSGDVNQISIRIPNKFTRGHRKNFLLSDVLIIVSDDKVWWSLGLMISGDGKLWLHQAPEQRNELNEQRSRKRALEAAKSFESNNPFYSVIIKASCFDCVYAPVPFMRRYLLSGDEKCVDCVLLVSDGGIWGPVKCFTGITTLMGGYEKVTLLCLIKHL